MSNKIIEELLVNGQIQEIMTAEEAVASDNFTTEKLGISVPLLMECAGKAIADDILSQATVSEVIIVIGPGNNGADAVVAGRHLMAQGRDVQFFLVSEKKKFNAPLKAQLKLLRKVVAGMGQIKFSELVQPIDSYSPKNPPRDIVVVDGIFGAGLSRPPSGKEKKAIEIINAMKRTLGNKCLVLSVDIPSGLFLDAKKPLGSFVKADRTVTFHHLKRAHISEPTKHYCGQCISSKIGLFCYHYAKNFYVHKQKVLTGLLKDISLASHKGNFGHILVYEGHPQYGGASRLSARAALRVGAGLVTVASNNAQVQLRDLMEVMYRQKKDISPQFLQKIDALVLGPGLSLKQQWQDEALDFLNSIKTNIENLVVDADGLMLLIHPNLCISKKTIVATPHAKEAARLLEWDVKEVTADPFQALDALTKLKINQTDNQIFWVLKGATTLVKEPTGMVFSFFGDLPLLSSGGSGDILSGAIAGLFKQAESPLAATLLAISMQIEAAKSMSQKKVRGVLASELADVFPALRNKAQK